MNNCTLTPHTDELPAATVSILAEIPEGLHEKLLSYLNKNPHADQDSIFTALAQFLNQSQS
jgi:Protein of unknown function (DUF2811)